jgi:hypothetical protein
MIEFTMSVYGIKAHPGHHAMSQRLALVGLLLVSIWGLPAGAEEANEKTPVTPPHESHQSPANLAEQATDPSAILTQLGFFYWSAVDEGAAGDAYNPADITGSASDTGLFQPVLPLSKNNVLRPALPFITTEPGNVEGMGDLFVLDAWFFQIPNATWGIGPVANFPIATDERLGTGKFSLGFDFLFLYKGVKKNIFGFLFYPQFSVGGDDKRDDVSNLTYQIIWVKHFKWGYIGWTDQAGVVDFERDNRYTFPMGIRVGKVFGAKSGKTLMNLTVQPYYTIQQDRDDVKGIKFSATFIKPEWMKH